MTAMPPAAQRKVLRWIHLVFSIPILGYIYGPIADVQQYVDAVRFVFVPTTVQNRLKREQEKGLRLWLNCWCENKQRNHQRRLEKW